MEAARLKKLPPYLFVEIDRKRRAALAAGRDVINFGIGDPDQPTPAFLVERLAAAAADPAHHRYPPDAGLPEFRAAAADFLRRRYGVSVDPATEVLGLIGTKEGLGHLPLAVVNPGNAVLLPDPGYPVYQAATLFAGGTPLVMPLTAERGWLPDFDAIAPGICQAAVLMFLNYPNNPTGAVATPEFFEQAVDFARRHGILIASDAAYNEVYYGEAPPASILQVPGAKEVAIEFHSLSKTFNMTGWRIGFAAGGAAPIAALARLKSNLDSGVFGAIQQVAILALQEADGPRQAALREIYRGRAARLCPALAAAGFSVQPPTATFYVWARVPQGYDGMTVAHKLLEEIAVVCIPGLGFGRQGAEYVRFALTVDEDRIDEAAQRLAGVRW